MTDTATTEEARTWAQLVLANNPHDETRRIARWVLSQTGLIIAHASPLIEGRTCQQQPDGTWKPLKWEDDGPIAGNHLCIASHDLPVRTPQ